MTAEVHKGTTYYRCTYNKPYDGKCPQGFFREQDLDRMVAGEVGDLYFDRALVGLVRRELVRGQLDRDEAEARELRRLETRRAKVDGILHAAIELKAEGKITGEECEAEIRRYRAEKSVLDAASEGLKATNVQCAKEAVSLLKLMSGFKETYAAQPLEVKAEILKVIVRGGRVKGGKLQVTWEEPFDQLFEMSRLFQKSGVWGE